MMNTKAQSIIPVLPRFPREGKFIERRAPKSSRPEMLKVWFADEAFGRGRYPHGSAPEPETKSPDQNLNISSKCPNPVLLMSFLKKQTRHKPKYFAASDHQVMGGPTSLPHCFPLWNALALSSPQKPQKKIDFWVDSPKMSGFPRIQGE
ncbi:MAG: hypothetical protein JWM04_1564 [Verrucomicrobiales bacterium]|nr:hypothetical protein [Verrucomicrobiales bacterium]